MRVRDRRHHAQESPHVEAANLLEDLAGLADLDSNIGNFWDSQRYHQRNREKFPDAFGNKPGAFIEERCTPEQRELLKNLKSDPDAPLPAFFRWLFPLGHPENKICGVLEWSPTTIWTFT